MNNPNSPEKSMAPVAVLALRTVMAEFEERFEAALHDFISRSLQTAGQLGATVMRPVQGSGSWEYGILRRFRNAECRDAFYESSLFREWEIKVASLTEEEVKHQHLSGLETWFVVPGQRALIPPPPWKMAIVTVMGVWPVSMLVPWLLNPLISGLSLTLQALFIAVGIVILLTWVVMPVLVRILKGWLYPL